MTTNFFSQLQALKLSQVYVAITFTDVDENGIPQNAMVSVLPKSDVEDKAVNLIPSLNLKNAPVTQFDEEFFQALNTPLQKVASLHANAKAFEEATNKATAAAKHKKADADKKKALALQLKNLVEAETFNPVTDHEKATKLAKEVLAVNPKDAKAKKVLADYAQYERPSLF